VKSRLRRLLAKISSDFGISLQALDVLVSALGVLPAAAGIAPPSTRARPLRHLLLLQHQRPRPLLHLRAAPRRSLAPIRHRRQTRIRSYVPLRHRLQADRRDVCDVRMRRFCSLVLPLAVLMAGCSAGGQSVISSSPSQAAPTVGTPSYPVSPTPSVNAEDFGNAVRFTQFI